MSQITIIAQDQNAVESIFSGLNKSAGVNGVTVTSVDADKTISRLEDRIKKLKSEYSELCKESNTWLKIIWETRSRVKILKQKILQVKQMGQWQANLPQGDPIDGQVDIEAWEETVRDILYRLDNLRFQIVHMGE